LGILEPVTTGLGWRCLYIFGYSDRCPPCCSRGVSAGLGPCHVSRWFVPSPVQRNALIMLGSGHAWLEKFFFRVQNMFKHYYYNCDPWQK